MAIHVGLWAGQADPQLKYSRSGDRGVRSWRRFEAHEQLAAQWLHELMNHDVHVERCGEAKRTGRGAVDELNCIHSRVGTVQREHRPC
ncbi:hypothetical protein KBY77_16340 [Synechococcus sp. Cruz-7E5]|nr:hypothetical protein [Synechococcus sp. Edmonson 11F2]MCP9864679.1 hypothetical protein [Synechococcus sp. Cruz-7E5]